MPEPCVTAQQSWLKKGRETEERRLDTGGSSPVNSGTAGNVVSVGKIRRKTGGSDH